MNNENGKKTIDVSGWFLALVAVVIAVVFGLLAGCYEFRDYGKATPTPTPTPVVVEALPTANPMVGFSPSPIPPTAIPTTIMPTQVAPIVCSEREYAQFMAETSHFMAESLSELASMSVEELATDSEDQVVNVEYGAMIFVMYAGCVPDTFTHSHNHMRFASYVLLTWGDTFREGLQVGEANDMLMLAIEHISAAKDALPGQQPRIRPIL